MSGTLTPRQTDILSLVTHGLSNQEIAARLGLDCGTVKDHLTRAYRRLGARSRAHAVVLWCRQVEPATAWAALGGEDGADAR